MALSMLFLLSSAAYPELPGLKRHKFLDRSHKESQRATGDIRYFLQYHSVVLRARAWTLDFIKSMPTAFSMLLPCTRMMPFDTRSRRTWKSTGTGAWNIGTRPASMRK